MHAPEKATLQQRLAQLEHEYCQQKVCRYSRLQSIRVWASTLQIMVNACACIGCTNIEGAKQIETCPWKLAVQVVLGHDARFCITE
jgi:hypothetical protein